MMKKLLIGIFAIIALAFAGKFGLEHQYKKKLDQLIRLASPFATISYGKINIDLKGGINLSDIRVSQVGDDNEASVKNIRVFSSNREFLYKGFDILKNNEFPKVFDIAIRRLEFDARFGQTFNDQRECRYIEEPIDISKFTDPRIVSDININLESDGDNYLKANLESDTNGISTTSANIVFEKSLIETKDISANDLPLKSVVIENSYDESYATDAIEYCAQKLSLSSEEYLANVIGSDSFYKILKAVPSPELKAAIQAQISGKNSLKFSATPNDTAKNFNQLMLYKPEQIINALSLEIEEDGKKITTLLGEPSETIEQEAITSTASAAAENKEPEEYFGRRIFKFKAISKSDIKNHIGKTAKIYRKKRLIKGEILKLKGNKLQIDNKRVGGSTIMSLPLSEINKIEIKVYERP
ncbi:MAG: hypothetical protein ACRBEE_03570 [Arenicella sp.]